MSDEDVAMKGIEAMEAFYHRIGMPVNMKELGINPTEEQMLQMAEGALKARGDSLGSAKVLGVEDVVAIYLMAKG